MEKIFEIIISETEKDYLLSTLSALIQIQKKIPKKMQTKKTEILHTIYHKLKEL